MEETESESGKETEMVWELIFFTVVGELIVINGLMTWYKYSDLMNELKGEQNK